MRRVLHAPSGTQGFLSALNQGHDCNLLAEVVDARAAELVRHADDVETLQRTLEHHIASLKLLENVQLPGAEMAQKLQIASHFAELVNVIETLSRQSSCARSRRRARSSMTLAVQRETLAKRA